MALKVALKVAIGGFAVAVAALVGVAPGSASAHGDGRGGAHGASHHSARLCSPSVARSGGWHDLRPSVTVTLERGGLDGDGAQLLDVHADSTAKPKWALTVVCVWIDSDGDGRWDPDVERGEIVRTHSRWVAGDDVRSSLDAQLALADAADERVCATVARRGLWRIWSARNVACIDPQPSVDVPEAPAGVALAASALVLAVAYGAIRRRQGAAA